YLSVEPDPTRLARRACDAGACLEQCRARRRRVRPLRIRPAADGYKILGRRAMPAIQSVVHFSIPVSDVERSTRFYTEIVGGRYRATVAQGTMAFLDAAGTCLILVKREPPINPRPEDHGGVHHSFAIAHDEYAAALDHLRKHGVEIT